MVCRSQWAVLIRPTRAGYAAGGGAPEDAGHVQQTLDMPEEAALGCAWQEAVNIQALEAVYIGEIKLEIR